MAAWRKAARALASPVSTASSAKGISALRAAVTPGHRGCRPPTRRSTQAPRAGCERRHHDAATHRPTAPPSQDSDSGQPRGRWNKPLLPLQPATTRAEGEFATRTLARRAAIRTNRPRDSRRTLAVEHSSQKPQMRSPRGATQCPSEPSPSAGLAGKGRSPLLSHSVNSVLGRPRIGVRPAPVTSRLAGWQLTRRSAASLLVGRAAGLRHSSGPDRMSDGRR
jgi:hypothetical protein